MFQTRLPDADPRTDASGLVEDTDDIIDDVKIGQKSKSKSSKCHGRKVEGK